MIDIMLLYINMISSVILIFKFFHFHKNKLKSNEVKVRYNNNIPIFTFGNKHLIYKNNPKRNLKPILLYQEK